MVESKPVVALMLLGRFDEAVRPRAAGARVWADAGRPPARWLAPMMYSLVLCHALRGDDLVASDWRTFAGVELAGDQTRNVHFQVRGMATFVEARLSLHFGRWDESAHLVVYRPQENAWWQMRHWYFDAYPWAVSPFAVAAGVAGRGGARSAGEPLGSSLRRTGPGTTHG